MRWDEDPIVLQLIEYMIRRGCGGTIGKFGVVFEYQKVTKFVHVEDIENALNAAYRVEWEPKAIAKRFERYLIDLHQQRIKQQNFNKKEGL